MATADESLAGGGRNSGYGTRREDEAGRQGLRLEGVVVRDMVSDDTFLRSTVMVLIPMSGPTYM